MQLIIVEPIHSLSVKSASVKFTISSELSMNFAFLRLACMKVALYKFAYEKFASFKVEVLKLVQSLTPDGPSIQPTCTSIRSAPVKLARIKSEPLRSARVRLALTSFVLSIREPVIFASVRLASVRLVLTIEDLCKIAL